MDSFLKAGGFLAHRPGRVLLFHGPFLRRREPPPDRPALYAPDFFLDDPAPWRVAAAGEEAPREAVRRRLPPGPPPPRLEWDEPDRGLYADAFADLERRIDRGEVMKAVPVVFAVARCPDPRRTLLPRLIRRALDTPAPLTPYGLWDEAGGMIGTTPETLFERDGGGVVRTMALAGTAAPGDAARRLLAAKERAEHRIVIDGVREALAPFGPVACGATEVLALPHLAHLKTEITVRASRAVRFLDLVRALHPTPALGGAPRAASLAWLRAHDQGVGRDRFGAPFGYTAGRGAVRCVVAIRSIAWKGDTLRLGAGGGIVADSDFDREWEELERKRDAVRKTLIG